MGRRIISLIVRCYNEQDHIERLLTGVFQQSITDIDVVVVDSGSTDHTLSIASKFPVRILQIRPEEFSFGGALNIGCQTATGKFVVLASAHVYPVYKDWLEQLIAPFSDPKIGLVYGKQRGNETTQYSEHRIFAKWFPNQSNLSQVHPFCNNANAAIRCNLWQRMPYDETLTGLEDIDWARRVLKLAYKIAYVSEAEVIHVHSEASKAIFNRYRREAIAMKRIFPEETFGLWEFLRLFIANSANDTYHAWQEGVFRKQITKIIVFRMMQFWGTYLGYAQRGPVSQRLRQTFYYPGGLSRECIQGTSSETRTRIEYACKRSAGQAE
jgi:glycosyltransferase involved in cell wall biosynthesis